MNDELKEQVRKEIRKAITESVSVGKTEQVNELFDPLSLGVGAVAGAIGIYTGITGKRKFDKVMASIGDFFKDPFSFKRKRLERMMAELKSMIETRDGLLSRGDNITVQELRNAEDIMKNMVKLSGEIRKFLNSEMEALNIDRQKDKFIELMSILNLASSGDMTFSDLKGLRP